MSGVLWPDWNDAYHRGYHDGAGDWFLYGCVLGFLGAMACVALASWLIWGGA